MGIAPFWRVPNSEPTIIALPRSKAILSFETKDQHVSDDDEALPSTIPNPPKAFEHPPAVMIAPIVYEPPPQPMLHGGWDEITRHNPVQAGLLSRHDATVNTRLPAAQAAPQSRRRGRHRRSPALQFTIAMAFGFGIGLLIAAFYFTGGFHALMHMR